MARLFLPDGQSRPWAPMRWGAAMRRHADSEGLRPPGAEDPVRYAAGASPSASAAVSGFGRATSQAMPMLAA